MAILLLNLGHAAAHFFLLLYPTVVLSLEAQAGAGYGDLLLPATAGFVAFAGATLPAGWLGDRWGRARTMSLFFPVLAVGALVAAAVPGAFGLTLGLALIGLAAAIYHPVGLPLLIETAAVLDRHRQGSRLGRRLGVNGVWGNMGVAAAPLCAAALTELLGWRAAFWLPGLAALLPAAAFPLVHGWRDCASAGGGRAGPAETALPTRGEFVRLMAALLVCAACGGLAFNVITIALPKLLAEVSAPSTTALWQGGGLASLVFAAAAFAQLPAGRLIDRADLRKLLLIALAAQVALLAALAFVLPAGRLAPALPLVALLVCVMFAEIPMNDALALRCASPRWRARLFSFKYLLSLGVAALAVPLIALSHALAGGFAPLLAGLAGLLLLAWLAVLALPRLYPAGDVPSGRAPG